MEVKENVKSAVTYQMIAEALFENYESIYDIHMETNAFKTYFQSDSYQELKLAKEGLDFFEALPAGIYRTIAPEDCAYVLQMLNKDTLLSGLEKEKYYQLVYRIGRGDRKKYHQLRATLQKADDGLHILMGIKNIDDLVRQQIKHKSQVESLQQKEHNHLEAVLASSAAYLEANLTKNKVLEKIIGHQEDKDRQIRDLPSLLKIPYYDDLQEWIADNLIVENRDQYLQICNREYLINCYKRGNKRASVSFSLYLRGRIPQPCRAVYFLYEDRATADIHVFCVIYDLTDQQKKEKELKELEEELNMSRIRNSTSQMQPHFLYNALGSIQELVLIDPQYAYDLLGDFMIHLRSCVRALSNDDLIMFSEELKNIHAYVNIEKMRMGDKLEMVYEIETENFPVLPLCIQPLVENAIRHGVHKRGRKGGRVTLRTRDRDDEWIVEVEDTGVGFDVGQINREVQLGTRDSTGFTNIRFRLDKVMNATMDIQSTEGEGTTVTVHIPKKEGDYNESDYRR